MNPHHGILIHLVGSIPLASADDVFSAVADRIGTWVTRFPDGETGDRKYWIQFQMRVLAGHPSFERLPDLVDPRNPKSPFGQFRLRPGIDPDTLTFPPLGYADEARRSYAIFKRKLEGGELPAGAKFQVALPTPMTFTSAFLLAPEDQEAVEPAYERAMLAELAEIAAAIPHDRLAIQWDSAREIIALERGAWIGSDGRARHFDDMAGTFARAIIRLCDAVPPDVELLVHLCYGDFGHRHPIEPKSLAICVDMANRLFTGAKHPIALLHVPVPRDRSDEAYFRPLAQLRLPAQTHLSLGLVHLTDGVEGALSRMRAADKIVHGYGIATECGFGRRPPETVHALLDLHAEVARRATSHQE